MQKEKKLKAPVRPLEPARPYVPPEPTPTIVTYARDALFEVANADDSERFPPITLDEFVTRVRGELDDRGVDPFAAKICFRVDTYGYDNGYADAYVCVSTPYEHPNRDYDRQLADYNKNLPLYQKSMSDYNDKMKAFEEKLRRYNEEKAVYDEKKRQNEIARLEARLQMLKNEGIT